ncbi:MAG: alpha/beta hydrolase [Deltaproteobacteria bacterium]
MKVERYSGTILSIPTEHHALLALFHHIVTDKEHLENKPVLLRLHGTLGNLLDDTEHFLPPLLADAGYSSMTVNTLLANLGLFFGFGIFEKVIPQIDAACDFLRRSGFKRIVIAGHGLGSCMALRYAALRNDPEKYPDLAGVIAIAAPYSLSDTVRRKWERFGSEPSYEEVYQRAKRIFEPEPGTEPADDEIILVKKAHGPSYRPEDTEIYTLKTWWALAGPQAEGTQNYHNISKIKVPLLLVYGLHDDIIDYQEFEELARIARDSGNDRVSQFALAADHKIEERHGQLGQAIVNWLKEELG